MFFRKFIKNLNFLGLANCNLNLLGLSIYSAKLNFSVMRRLHDLKPGTKAIVLDIVGNSALTKKLLGMGLTKGVELKVVRNAPLKDPMEIEVRGYYLSLRKAEAENVIVEVKEE